MSSEVIFENGVVIKANPETIVVRMIDNNSCQSCSINKICGLNNKKEIEFKNDENFIKGDLVNILITPSQRLIASFLAFILPIFLLMLFYFISSKLLHFKDSYSILFSFLWLPIWVFLIKTYDKKSKKFEYKLSKKEHLS
jgi:positive regulator of sigma E activity